METCVNDLENENNSASGDNEKGFNHINHKKLLLDDIVNQYNNAEIADFNFVVEKEKVDMIPAHKFILGSRSNFFKNIIENTDEYFLYITNSESLRAILKYLYQAELFLGDYNPETLMEIVELAKKFELNSLVTDLTDCINKNEITFKNAWLKVNNENVRKKSARSRKKVKFMDFEIDEVNTLRKISSPSSNSTNDLVCNKQKSDKRKKRGRKPKITSEEKNSLLKDDIIKKEENCSQSSTFTRSNIKVEVNSDNFLKNNDSFHKNNDHNDDNVSFNNLRKKLEHSIFYSESCENYKKEILELKDNIRFKDDQLSKLKSLIEVKDKEISNLYVKINDKEDKINNAEIKYQNLESKYKDLEQKHHTLELQFKNSQEENVKLKDEVHSLKNFISQLEDNLKVNLEKFNAENEENKSLKSQISLLEVDLKMNLENFRLEIEETKSKLWCDVCKKEADNFCCWNRYCSKECRDIDWAREHYKYCFRLKQVNQPINNSSIN